MKPSIAGTNNRNTTEKIDFHKLNELILFMAKRLGGRSSLF